MKTDREKLIGVFVRLGERLEAFGQDGVSREAIARAVRKNGWFTTDGIATAVANIRHTMLSEEALRKWVAAYDIVAAPKDVGVIMAGNIPLVGFFDLLCILVSGHRLFYKVSSKDAALMEHIVSQLKNIDSGLPIEKLENQPLYAIIATGSDNTNRYFRSRYGQIPAIFRGSRSSVAVLNGNETKQELSGLADDIFTYSGLGCRNVSHLTVPAGYDFGTLTQVLDKWEGVNPKYLNNLRQRSSMLAVEGRQHIRGNHYILREDHEFPAYISEITWHASGGHEETERWLAANDSRIQCVAGMTAHPRGVAFGHSQSPDLTDYPDAADVMEFLTAL